jgi:hypothetical protein
MRDYSTVTNSKGQVSKSATLVASSSVDRHNCYGGALGNYEAIRVSEAWTLGFCLGNTVKSIARAGEMKGGLSTSSSSLTVIRRKGQCA